MGPKKLAYSAQMNSEYEGQVYVKEATEIKLTNFLQSCCASEPPRRVQYRIIAVSSWDITFMMNYCGFPFSVNSVVKTLTAI